MDPISMRLVADDIIMAALREDITFEDVSTASVCPAVRPAEVQLIAKGDGVVAGLDVFARTFALLDPQTRIEATVADGDEVVAGQRLAIVRGDARAHASFTCTIEVECENLDMVREAAEAGADIIMLDNMDHDAMREAIELIAGRAKTEASGNVDASNIRALADLGVDYVSSGALTHSAPILDLSLKHLRMLDAEAAR